MSLALSQVKGFTLSQVKDSSVKKENGNMKNWTGDLVLFLKDETGIDRNTKDVENMQKGINVLLNEYGYTIAGVGPAKFWVDLANGENLERRNGA